jgi:site-specific recombinase XerD
MKYSLNFIIRNDLKNSKGKCPLHIRYTHKRKWKNLTLNYSLEPQFWDETNSTISRKYPNYINLKKLMNDYESKLIDKINDYYLQYKEYPSVDILSDLVKKHKVRVEENKVPSVKSLYNDFVEFKKSEWVKQSTLNIYKYTWDKWVMFQEKTSWKELNEMNEKTLSEFKTFLLGLGLQKNTIGKYIKTIKTFLRYVSNKLEMVVPPSFQRVKVDKEEKNDFQVFTKEEFENLKREVFFSRYYNQNRFNLTEREILIGRIMIFLCSTGLSYVDFDRLTINDLFIDKDNLDTKKKYLNIKIHRQKLNTTEVCIIPIIDITIDLLIEMLGLTYKFYVGDDSDVDLSVKMRILEKLIKIMKKGEILTKHQPRLFPKVFVQDFNKEIKLLLCKIGMNSEVVIRKQVKNNVVEKVYPKYELITSHTGRRTYITSCLQQGIRPHILMKTTGHKKIGTLLRYNQETELNIFNEFDSKINTKVK